MILSKILDYIKYFSDILKSTLSRVAEWLDFFFLLLKNYNIQILTLLFCRVSKRNCRMFVFPSSFFLFYFSKSLSEEVYLVWKHNSHSPCCNCVYGCLLWNGCVLHIIKKTHRISFPVQLSFHSLFTTSCRTKTHCTERCYKETIQGTSIKLQREPG